jgi:hypothetical protein
LAIFITVICIGVTLLVGAVMPGAGMLGGTTGMGPMFVVSLALTALVWSLYIWEPNALIKPERRYRSVRDAVSDAFIVLALSGYPLFVLSWSNILLDPEKTYEADVRVERLGQFALKGTKFEYAEVRGWPKAHSLVEIDISKADRATLQQGDELTLVVGDGLFGIGYVKGYTRAD